MKLINVDRILELRKVYQDKEHGNPHFIHGAESVIEFAEAQPEAVVRCKGCKWRDGLCHYYTIHHNDNWFCADGERVEKR